jgi:hypothetical protein
VLNSFGNKGGQIGASEVKTERAKGVSAPTEAN